MLKMILTGLGAIVALFLAIVAVQPSEFKVVREATVFAPTRDVFTYVNDLHQWETWSPWARLDPAARTEFDGPYSGEGAVFSWSGNRQVGEGRMTVTESVPYQLIRIRVDLVRPLSGSNTTEFAFASRGDQTGVTWSMSGRNNFIAKAMCLFVNMDKVLGADMEKGFTQMKRVVETAAAR